ncbi:unnamed protein product [Acanthoscelides obtectus]|uniref:Cell cycle checkpoint protein RAD1 n=1 Tax=Acanthoscelides obtectus TaxID=200917 RepID=A0A9P0LMC2_ACAOB|nr:unnamed protein product [Acanthoscelides obtectus]CAK1631721.1 Cell cycle checkpoint protein RAD1 [Acanthoscelides obtectus]
MLFSAEITDFKIVYNVLRSIAIKDFVLLRPMEEGLKLTLDEMRCVETSAYMPREMFTAYHVAQAKDVILKVSLKALVDVLNIFGEDCSPNLKVMMSYKSEGSSLCIDMQEHEENITINCELKTLTVDDANQISLADECNLNKVVLNAQIFAELLNRLDNSADELKVVLGPDPPYFTLSTTGIAGESQVSISKNSDSVTVFQCSEQTVSTYQFSNIKFILKVMGYADKVAVSTGSSAKMKQVVNITLRNV